MSRLWLVVAGLSAALVVSGCSSDDTAPASSSSAPGAPAEESSSAVEPIGTSDCVDLTSANLGLLVATTKEDAQKAADTLLKYNPPAKAKAGIEHFVGTGGTQLTDPDYDKNNEAVTSWVRQLCPPS
ncbi:hypothetical protein [Antrihabitans stalactiti]|uniref:DUF732 domain-containing protein n=1 Tax=Antrihabitans stalactiti TaxID=2584121 RepID=A0A848KEY8_9NOCA|nr:hypothetical protein [Antrihabitans stalactiti]NMN96869.1 hypothetical protein [Antrihabitans stalactiti]